MLKRRKIKTRTKKKTTSVEFIGSGSTLLNLALSGKGQEGGWARGRIVNIVGDKSSGKTLLALEACFWFFKNIKRQKSNIFPRVKKPIIVYNNAEGVMDFDIEKMYGEKFNNAVIWQRSPNIEHFGRDYARRVDNLKKGESLLYILDTLDFLRSKKSLDRFEESIKKDDDEKGSYDMEKQKFLSSFFASTSEFLSQNKKDSTLIIISQVREKINVTFGKRKMRTGGKAFGHAIHQEAWISEIQKLRKTIKGEKRTYGIQCKVVVEKNKCAKPFRDAEFQIIYDYGLDNISSIIDYLWGSKKIVFEGQSFPTKKKFIRFIEENNYEHLLEREAEIKWQAIEESFEKEIKNRKKRW